MSNVACPNHETLWITFSASIGRSCVTVFESLKGEGATNVRPTVPSCRTLRLFNSDPSVRDPFTFGLTVYVAVPTTFWLI